MKSKHVLIICCLLLVAGAVRAQKALPIQVNELLARIPMPSACASSYDNCVIETASNGAVTVKDIKGPIAELEKQMEQLMRDRMNSLQSSSSMSSAPSADQIAKMQQQAQQMQGMTPEQAMQAAKNKSPNGPSDMATVGKKVGQA